MLISAFSLRPQLYRPFCVERSLSGRRLRKRSVFKATANMALSASYACGALRIVGDPGLYRNFPIPSWSLNFGAFCFWDFCCDADACGVYDVESKTN